MPFIKLLIHTVWATKDRKPLMNKANKDFLCNHIREYSYGKNIHLININGHLDHLHCFILMAAEQNIATLMNLIKGESSYWANKHLKWTEKFGWQDDYFAVSVGESQFDAVNSYISNQEEHHQRKTFQQEYDEFIKNYQFED
jgi:REP element-mobilizing transposase RayT